MRPGLARLCFLMAKLSDNLSHLEHEQNVMFLAEIQRIKGVSWEDVHPYRLTDRFFADVTMH